jgi:hypothetical protein
MSIDPSLMPLILRRAKLSPLRFDARAIWGASIVSVVGIEAATTLAGRGPSVRY